MLIVEKDNLIYEVNKVKVHDQSKLTMVYELDLICGYDYISPDYNDAQGYVSANNFVDEVQDDTIYVCFNESFEQRLIEEGYTLIDKLPKIHVRD